MIGFVAVVIAGTTIPAFGCERIVSTSRAAHSGGTSMSLLQNATSSPRAASRPWFIPRAKPRFSAFENRVVRGAHGERRRLGLRAVVDDDQLVVDAGVATNRVDERLGELEVVPGEARRHVRSSERPASIARQGSSPLSRRGDRTETRMSSRELPLPTFLIIGAQKCATRWLRFNLGLHPDVYVAPTELSFFNNGHRIRRPRGCLVPRAVRRMGGRAHRR